MHRRPELDTPEAQAKRNASHALTRATVLSDKQEKFAVHVASGSNYAESARLAGFAPATAASMGSQLAHKPKVMARIAQLTALTTSDKILSIIARKERLSDIATEDNRSDKGSLQRGSNIAAIIELNKMDNVYVREPRVEGVRILNINVHDKETAELMTRMAAGELREGDEEGEDIIEITEGEE